MIYILPVTAIFCTFILLGYATHKYIHGSNPTQPTILVNDLSFNISKFFFCFFFLFNCLCSALSRLRLPLIIVLWDDKNVRSQGYFPSHWLKLILLKSHLTTVRRAIIGKGLYRGECMQLFTIFLNCKQLEFGLN